MNELAIILTKKNKVKNLIIYFFTYSFIGWILETVYAFIVTGGFVNRGFLFGPICPIYGFGAVLLIILLSNVKGQPLYEFFISALAFAIFEYMVSYILEVIFGLRWWDYSNEFMNLQGRVSLIYSIVWGMLGIFLIEFIHPFISNKIEKLKKYINIKFQNVIIFLMILIIILDTIISSFKYIIR